jgi:tetratricopeptide (TPR) repeat protein
LRQNSTNQPWLWVGLPILIVIAYSNSFDTGFTLDNKQLILNDARVHAATIENVELIINRSYWWPYGESGLYRPFTTFSYLLNYAILGSGDRPAAYHWTNLIIHTVNALLVYVLVWRITGQILAAIATAAIWAVMPLSTEAVTNIVGRADLLAAFAVLAGLLIHLKGREATGATRWRWSAGLMAVTAIGVFSKESAIMLPAVIALYELVWGPPRQSARALRRAALAMAPPILLMWLMRSTVLSAAATAEFPFVDNPITAASYWAGPLTAFNVMARYLSLLAWPVRLSVDYSYAQIPLAEGSLADWITMAGILVLAAATIYLRQRQRALFFFVVFAFLSFLPVSNLLFASGTIMAERLMYLPSVGIAAAIVVAMVAAFGGTGASLRSSERPPLRVRNGGLRRSARSELRARVVPFVVVAVVVLAFAARTWMRNRDWRDDVTLWSAAVSVSPNSAKAHRALAEALYDADPTRANIERVIEHAERSVALLDSLPDELNSFQSYRQAAAYYLDARHTYPRALELLQRALVIVDAASRREGAHSSGPKADIDRLLASTYLRVDNSGRALDAAREARLLDPLNALGHRLVGAALVANNRPEEAAVALMVGSMVAADASLRDEVIRLYRSGLGGSCAIVEKATGPVIDPTCPMVRRHLCTASAESVAMSLHVGRREQAEQLKSGATQLRCP